jgi:hypothetical protein
VSDGSKRNIKIPVELTEPYFDYNKREIYDELFEIKCYLCTRKLAFSLKKNGFSCFKQHLKTDKHKRMLKKRNNYDNEDDSTKKKSHFIEPLQIVGDQRIYKIIKYKNKFGEVKEVKHNPKIDKPYFTYKNEKIYDEGVEITCNLCFSKFFNKFESYWVSLNCHLKQEKHKKLALEYELRHKLPLQSILEEKTIETKQPQKRKLSNEIEDTNKKVKYFNSSGIIEEVAYNSALDESWLVYEECDIYGQLIEFKCLLCNLDFNNHLEYAWNGLNNHLNNEIHLKNYSNLKNSLNIELPTNSATSGKRFKSSSTLISTDDIICEKDSQNETLFDNYDLLEESNPNACSSTFQNSISFNKFIALTEAAVSALEERESIGCQQNEFISSPNECSDNNINERRILANKNTNIIHSNEQHLSKIEQTIEDTLVFDSDDRACIIKDSNNNITTITPEFLNLQQKKDHLEEEIKRLNEQLVKTKDERNRFEMKYKNLYEITKNKRLLFDAQQLSGKKSLNLIDKLEKNNGRSSICKENLPINRESQLKNSQSF